MKEISKPFISLFATIVFFVGVVPFFTIVLMKTMVAIFRSEPIHFYITQSEMGTWVYSTLMETSNFYMSLGFSDYAKYVLFPTVIIIALWAYYKDRKEKNERK